MTILTSIGFVLGFGHARPLRTDRMEQAYVLLDASAPLDVKLLERTVETFYNAGGKEEVSETPGVRERHETKAKETMKRRNDPFTRTRGWLTERGDGCDAERCRQEDPRSAQRRTVLLGQSGRRAGRKPKHAHQVLRTAGACRGNASMLQEAQLKTDTR